MGETGQIRVDGAPALCCVHEESGLNLDITVTCGVIFDCGISDPAVCCERLGVEAEQLGDTIGSLLKRETDSALVIAWAKVTQEDISYHKLQESGETIAGILSEQMTETWRELYGVEISGTQVVDIKASERDEQTIASLSHPVSPLDMLQNPVPSESHGTITEELVKAVETSEQPQVTVKPWLCRCGALSRTMVCAACGREKPASPYDRLGV